MLVTIRVANADEVEALKSLYRWLSRDPELDRHCRVSLAESSQAPAEMSAVADMINAVFADAGAAAGIGSLLVAFRSWRETRTQAPAFTIEKDGVTVVVNHGSAQEVYPLLDALRHDNDGTPVDASAVDEEHLREA